jgi:hypothetical protein
LGSGEDNCMGERSGLSLYLNRVFTQREREREREREESTLRSNRTLGNTLGWQYGVSLETWFPLSLSLSLSRSLDLSSFVCMCVSVSTRNTMLFYVFPTCSTDFPVRSSLFFFFFFRKFSCKILILGINPFFFFLIKLLN